MILRISLLLLLLPVTALPQKISSLKIRGNSVFASSDYLLWSGFNNYSPNSDSLQFRIKKNILEELSFRGYFNPKIEFDPLEIDDDSTAAFNLTINELDPAFINNIYFNNYFGDSLLISKSMDLLSGAVYNKFDLEESLNSLLDYYENNGFPFAKFEIVSIILHNDSVNNEQYVDLYIDLIKDSLSLISNIVINGNSSTKDFVIIRELRINKDETYSRKKIEDFPKKLNRLRFFEPVENPFYYFDTKGNGILQINIKEKQTNNFDAIIGYIPPPNDKEKGYITGLVNISLRNLFGTGRAAAFRWQQYNRYSQELEVKYLEPWVLSYPFNIRVSLFQRKQDSTYVQRKVEGGLDFLATESISASFFIAQESIIPTELTVPRFTVYSSGNLILGLSFDLDTRDDPYAPQSGVKFNTAYSLSNKSIYVPEIYLNENTKTKLTFQRLSVDFNFFYLLFKRQVVALGVHAAELKGDNFEESDLYRLGGTNTLRGYRENQFLANRIAFSNLEYRFLLSKRTYAFLFYDAGYYFRKAELDKNILQYDGFKMGYGAGLNLETGLGVLSVSYALAKGESFRDGKIHFGIVNEF